MVFAILLAIAAVAAALVLAVRVQRQGKALAVAGQRIETLELDIDTARLDRAQQVLRADTAEAERDEASTRVAALEEEVRAASATLQSAVRTRDEAIDEANRVRSMLESRVDAEPLWALELARLERRWHVSVAPGIDLTSPLTEGRPADRPRIALEIIAAAIREETGTRIAITWQLTNELPTTAALLTVRAGDEMLAAAASLCEDAELQVTDRDGRITLSLEAADGEGVPVELPPITFATGLERTAGLEIDGTRVSISLTAAAAAVAA